MGEADRRQQNQLMLMQNRLPTERCGICDFYLWNDREAKRDNWYVFLSLLSSFTIFAACLFVPTAFCSLGIIARPAPFTNPPSVSSRLPRALCTHLLPQPPSHLLRVSLVSWARIWFNRLPIFFLFLPWFCSFLAGGAAGIAKWTNHGVAWRLLRVCLAAREGRWRLGSSQIQQPFHGHLHAVSLRQQYFCYPSQMLHLDC